MGAFNNSLNSRLGSYSMKRETFAKLLGIGNKVAVDWLEGESFPNEEQVLRIAELFGDSPTTITEQIEKDKKAKEASSAYGYLLNRVRRLSPEEAMALYAQLTGGEKPDEKVSCPDLFYENFLALCAGVDKSPSRVAAEIGISKSAISRWGDGGGISDATAFKVANYFGISVKTLKEAVAKE